MLPSYYDAIRPLSSEDRLRMYDALMDYAFAGKYPEDLPPLLNGYFVLLKPNIDSSVSKYAASVENGKKGGRPKKKPNENPTQTQRKPSNRPDSRIEHLQRPQRPEEGHAAACQHRAQCTSWTAGRCSWRWPRGAGHRQRRYGVHHLGGDRPCAEILRR